MPAESSILRRPDAVRCPWEWPENLPPDQRLEALRQEFGPLFGTGKAFKSEIIDMHPKTAFIRGEAHAHHKYPYGHPKQGECCHEWFVAEKGADGKWGPVAPLLGIPGEEKRVQLGYLKEDLHASNPQVQATIAAAYADRLAAAKADPATRQLMADLGLIAAEVSSGS